MMSPTVHARRCLLYAMNENAQEALTDAFEAQVVSPEWPTALYLKAALLVQARHGPMHRKLLNTVLHWKPRRQIDADKVFSKRALYRLVLSPLFLISPSICKYTWCIYVYLLFFVYIKNDDHCDSGLFHVISFFFCH